MLEPTKSCAGCPATLPIRQGGGRPRFFCDNCRSERKRTQVRESQRKGRQAKKVPPTPRACADCEVPLPIKTGRGNHSGRCEPCRLEYRRKQSMEIGRRWRADRRPTSREYRCEDCKGEFADEVKSGPIPKRCDSCGAEHRARTSLASQRRRAAERSTRPARFVCTICYRSKAMPRTGLVPICCAGCRPEYQRRYARARYDRLLRTPDRTDLMCPDCGVLVPAQRRGAPRLRCRLRAKALQKQQRAVWLRENPEWRRAKSREQKRRRRLVLRGVGSERFTDRSVFERDGWMCGICGTPVDPALLYPNLLSASLDHTVPLDQGGLHHLDNVRCAHFICNSRKGNRLDSQLVNRHLMWVL